MAHRCMNSEATEKMVHVQPALAFLHHEPYAERRVWEVSHWACF